MKIIEGKSVYSVSEINALARQQLENLNFWVEGEISSFKGLNTHYRYLYFDLKDPQSGYKLPCILEPEIYQILPFSLADGQKILALGNLTLWEKEAKFQMYVHEIREFGQGFLLMEIEKLKKKLEVAGYFDPKNKTPLPTYPTNIAVITSQVADAWFDFKRHSVDLFPIIKITLFNVKVQGSEAPLQITAALARADRMNFDAIVLTRGGGSLEDLSSFNDEQLAIAIFHAKTPIVVGVGHEKDITIASLVADVAASTPTDAAKIITADFVALTAKLQDYYNQLTHQAKSMLFSCDQQVDILFHRLATHKQKYQALPAHLKYLEGVLKRSKDNLISNNLKVLKGIKNSLKSQLQFLLYEKGSNLKSFKDKLIILSPQNTLRRGYSITYNLQGQIIKSAAALAVGHQIQVKFAKGRVHSQVTKREL